MAAPSVHGAIHRQSSGDRMNSTEGNRRPPPLSSRDLISALPDAVIDHIFSFLPLQDVVKTSVLSKRWRSTWTTTTHLAFSGVRRLNCYNFPSLVDTVLGQCTSPVVKKFHVTDFKYDMASCPKLDHWLGFATRRCVEDLCLRLISERWSMYELPVFFYCSSRLVRLEVSLCCFSLGVMIKWPCLKVLSIEYAELSEESLGQILRGSPVLESLELRQCWGLRNIIIDSTSVKDLLFIGAENSDVEKISAPYLHSLRVSGMWNHRIFRLGEISSLVEAELVFSVRSFGSRQKRMCYDLLKEFFEKLRGVTTMTIGGWCLKVLSLWEMEGVTYALSKCQNLIIHAPVSQWDLPGIAYMLGSSHYLKKLVIHLTGVSLLKYRVGEGSKDRFKYDEEDFLCSWKGKCQCLVKHLERVEIIGFKANSFGSKHLLALIKFLLGDTLALDKMIIKADLRARNGQKRLQATALSKLLGVSQDVLSYQRASKNAKVIFNHSFK